eukprot:gb/GECG01012452.1/.p1 GENE.gb/GECG01012452.1/~~gb/GECG01012452.1/.p1  ORF type:complete len:567 (+),score=65.35 gb/GECG01012452.1/:1-1701(+)
MKPSPCRNPAKTPPPAEGGGGYYTGSRAMDNIMHWQHYPRSLAGWVVLIFTLFACMQPGQCTVTVKTGSKSNPQVVIIQQMMDVSLGTMQTDLAYQVKLYGDKFEDTLDDHPDYFLSRLHSNSIDENTKKAREKRAAKRNTPMAQEDSSPSSPRPSSEPTEPFSVPWYEQRWALPDFVFNMKEVKLYNPIQEFQYTCLLPNEENTEQLKASRNEWPDNSEESISDESDHGKAGHSDSVEETLSNYVQQRGENCLMRRYGYWAYRVCPNNYVEQVHVEGSISKSDKAVERVLLGKYNAELDHLTTMDGEQYYTQVYENGDEGRKTKVMFLCAADLLPNGVQEDIVGFSEPESRYYQIKIGVADSSVCGKLSSLRYIMKPINGSCSSLNKGWWTYEVCLGSHVKQFHQEGKSIVSQFLLGKFNKTVDTYVDEGDPSMRLPSNSRLARNQPPEYLPAAVQKFDQGTLCDISNAPRQAEVRIQCGVGHFVVTSIKEIRTCQYMIFVTSSHVCEHPALKQVEQLEIPESANINCVPSSTFEQYKTSLLQDEKQTESRESFEIPPDEAPGQV